MSDSVKRVLPAELFDAMELSALAFGGIGAGLWFDIEGENEANPIPMCAIGHAASIVGEDDYNRAERTPTARILIAEGITTKMNDDAVRAINLRNNSLGSRVSWKDYCDELNIVRGAGSHIEVRPE